jgi:hypothetical protein
MPLGARPQRVKLSQDPESQFSVDGFQGGLNTLVSPQKIANNECSILNNAEITEDGVITRRRGQAYYDSSTDGSQVLGLGTYTTYDANGVATHNLLKMDESGNLKKQNLSTKAWSTITGKTWTTGLNTEFVQGANSNASKQVVYIMNGKDNLSYTDGTTITTYTPVTDPVAGLALSTAGTAGTQKYTYAYTLVTKYGETLPCSTVTLTTGNPVPTTSDYNILTITRSSDANVTGYNVYGRYNNLMFFLAFVPQTQSGNAVWNDLGDASKNFVVSPNTVYGLPSSNTTLGKVVSFGCAYHSSFICAGDPGATSVVYFSAGVGLFDDFQLVNGGGFVFVNPEDGDMVTAVLPYKDKVVIFKNRSSWLFYFDGSGNSQLQLINPFIGCQSFRTAKVVLNDVFFLSPAGGVFTLGYQQGYYGVGTAELLRTQEVSIKIHPTIAAMNQGLIQKPAAIYSASQYKYILAYPDGASVTNNKCAVYDTRYSAWVMWDNMHPNCWVQYIDANNVEHVLYGSDTEGRVVESMVGTSDFGGAFTFQMRTKDFNVGAFQLLKTFIWPTFHFRNIYGSVKITVVTDGSSSVKTVNISSTTNYTGWSFDRWRNFLWGTTSGSSASATAADAPRQLTERYDARSIMFLFENTSASDSFSLLGVQSRYILRKGRRLEATNLIM